MRMLVIAAGMVMAMTSFAGESTTTSKNTTKSGWTILGCTMGAGNCKAKAARLGFKRYKISMTCGTPKQPIRRRCFAK